MDDIDINTKTICNLYKSIYIVKDKINSLSTAISNIDKSDLSTSYLLDEVKSQVDNFNGLEIEILEYQTKKQSNRYR